MKKTRIILAALMALVVALAALTACDGGGSTKETEHTHTFDENWLYDDTDHWHPATCEHEDEVSAKAPHEDEDGNDICDECGYRKAHEHAYESTWTQGTDTHYYKNTCGHDDLEKYRKDEASHNDENNDGLCDTCAYDYGHTHTYDEAWTLAEGGHWHIATCGHDIPGAELSDHADADNNGICDGCGYDYDHTHTFDTAWTTDDDSHWHKPSCGHDVPVADKGAHVDADKDGACDTCALVIAHYHDFEAGWTSDASGHWHKATCHPDAKDAEAPHNGYEEDGVCDTCGYTVFHFYTVSVILPDDSVTVTAPDGTAASFFVLKEGTDATFKLTMPTRDLLVGATGAAIEGKPQKTEDGLGHTYTLKLTAIAADTAVALSIDTLANVEVIIPEGSEEMTIEKKWSNVTGTLTVTLPSSGRYIIYSPSHPGMTGVIFSLEGNTVEQDDSTISYAFDVSGAGDVTLSYTYFVMSIPAGGKETFTYVVAKVDPDKTLYTMEGTGYTMPTNATVKVSVTLPEPGLYQISSSYPVAWDGDVTAPHVFEAKAGALTVTLSMQYNIDSAATFPFDWKIERVADPTPVKACQTAVTVPKKGYYGITYTAERDGTYYFGLDTVGAELYHWYSDEYYSGMTQLGRTWISDELKAGDTVTLYLRTDIYNNEITSDLAAALLVAYTPDGVAGDYTAPTDALNVYYHDGWDTTAYSVTAPAGVEFSVDGGKTWLTSLKLDVEGYGIIAYLIRTSDGAATATVHIEKITYEHTLTVGANTVTLEPGVEYTVTLSGSTGTDYYKTYILTWTDPAITVTYAGATLTSGASIQRYDEYSSYLTVLYSGTSEATISFTLVEG